MTPKEANTMLTGVKKTVALCALVTAAVGSLIATSAAPALAGTCTFGGPPSQYYCTSSTWSYGGGWTNTMATIQEVPAGGGPAQSVLNAVGIYRHDASGWVNVSSRICPDSISCSATFGTQELVPTSDLIWATFAATGPGGQVIEGSLHYGYF